jgi:hypothetical protein
MTRKYAGVAQAEHRPSRPEIPVSSPGPRSIIRAFAAGFAMDPEIVARGRADGKANVFRLSADDIVGNPDGAFSYLSGFHQARRN